MFYRVRCFAQRYAEQSGETMQDKIEEGVGMARLGTEPAVIYNIPHPHPRGDPGPASAMQDPGAGTN